MISPMSSEFMAEKKQHSSQSFQFGFVSLEILIQFWHLGKLAIGIQMQKYRLSFGFRSEWDTMKKKLKL